MSVAVVRADELSEEFDKFMSFSRCPRGVNCSRLLDGGTIGFEIMNADFQFYEFCLDGRQFYSPEDPEERFQKVYLRCQKPDSEEAVALPFKGKEEEKMKAMIRLWIQCGQGSDIKYLESLLTALDGGRIKKPMTNSLK